jgi:hypothetical protein
MAKFKTFRDLGAEVQRRSGAYGNIDPEEVGKRYAEKYGIQVGDDRSFASKAFDDLGRTIGEDVGGLVDAISSPIQTAKGLGKLVGGAADINLGTDFVDDETEELARGAGNQFIDEIKDFENRPVRALSNLAVGAGPLGMLGKLGKAGKLGKIARVAHAAEYADPLTAIGRGVGKVGSGALNIAGGGTRKALEGVERTDMGFVKEYITSISGMVSSKGPRAIQMMWEAMKDPESRKEIMRVAKSPDALADAEVAFIQNTDKIFAQRDAAYRAAKAELEASGDWDNVLIENAEEGLADLFNEGFSDAERPIGARVERVEVRPDLDATQSATLNRDGSFTSGAVEAEPQFEYRLRFDETQISDQAKGNIQQLWRKAQRIAQQNKGGLTMGDIDGVKKTISREIDSFAQHPKGVSEEAKIASITLKNALDSRLKDNPAYTAMAGEYSRTSDLMNRVEKYLEFDRNKVDRADAARPRQKHLGNALGRVFDSQDSNASKRLETIREVEKETGDGNILNRQMGAEMSDFMGGGLVGRAEMSQGARRLWSAVGSIGGAGIGVGLATGSALLGGLATIPAFIILSPRATLATTSLLMRMGVGGKQARKIGEQMGRDADRWRAAVKRSGMDPAKILAKMKEQGVTVGALAKETRRPAQQERRLEKDQKQKNIFRTLGAR